MSAARAACAASLVLALASCSIGKPIPQPTTYAVELPAPAGAPAVTRRPESLRIGNVRVAAAYAGSALIYRTDDVRLTADPYNQFITEPGAMFADQMAAWLDREGPFKTVSRTESTRPTYYILEATVTELYGDFRPRQTPAAVLAIQFTLLDQSGTRPRAVLERIIVRRVDLPHASPDALLRGYNTALTEILSELTTALQETRPS
jgi:uncharacterized lipoprotein YmbA